jgi:hypothetical protein
MSRKAIQGGTYGWANHSAWLVHWLPPQRCSWLCWRRHPLPKPVATGGARPDIIGTDTASVLTGSTRTGEFADMAIAGIARELVQRRLKEATNSHQLAQ